MWPGGEQPFISKSGVAKRYGRLVDIEVTDCTHWQCVGSSVIGMQQSWASCGERLGASEGRQNLAMRDGDLRWVSLIWSPPINFDFAPKTTYTHDEPRFRTRDRGSSVAQRVPACRGCRGARHSGQPGSLRLSFAAGMSVAATKEGCYSL